MEDITIVEVPARQVIGIRKTGSYNLIPELLMRVCEYAVKENLVITGLPIFICHEISPEAVMEANEKGEVLSSRSRGLFRVRPGAQMT